MRYSKDLVKKSLAKGASVKIIDYEMVVAVVAYTNSKEVGRFVFSKDGKLVKKLIKIKGFYSLNLARYEFSKYQKTLRENKK